MIQIQPIANGFLLIVTQGDKNSIVYYKTKEEVIEQVTKLLTPPTEPRIVK